MNIRIIFAPFLKSYKLSQTLKSKKWSEIQNLAIEPILSPQQSNISWITNNKQIFNLDFFRMATQLKQRIFFLSYPMRDWRFKICSQFQPISSYVFKQEQLIVFLNLFVKTGHNSKPTNKTQENQYQIVPYTAKILGLNLNPQLAKTKQSYQTLVQCLNGEKSKIKLTIQGIQSKQLILSCQIKPGIDVTLFVVPLRINTSYNKIEQNTNNVFYKNQDVSFNKSSALDLFLPLFLSIQKFYDRQLISLQEQKHKLKNRRAKIKASQELIQEQTNTQKERIKATFLKQINFVKSKIKAHLQFSLCSQSKNNMIDNAILQQDNAQPNYHQQINQTPYLLVEEKDADDFQDFQDII